MSPGSQQQGQGPGRKHSGCGPSVPTTFQHQQRVQRCAFKITPAPLCQPTSGMQPAPGHGRDLPTSGLTEQSLGRVLTATSTSFLSSLEDLIWYLMAVSHPEALPSRIWILMHLRGHSVQKITFYFPSTKNISELNHV